MVRVLIRHETVDIYVCLCAVSLPDGAGCFGPRWFVWFYVKTYGIRLGGLSISLCRILVSD